MFGRHFNRFLRQLPTRSLQRSTLFSGKFREKCNYMCTAATALPEQVLYKKELGKLTIRPLGEADLNEVNKLILTRDLIDFSETDIYSMLKSPQFLGVVIENEDKRIVCYGGTVRYADDAAGGGHMIVLDNYRKVGLPASATNYAQEHNLNGAPLHSYGYDDLIRYYESTKHYFDKSFGRFFRIKGTFGNDYIERRAESGTEIVKAEDVDFQKLSLFDANVHTQSRSEILSAMCFHPLSKAFVALKGNEISGYGILRKAFRSYKVAPLFAHDTMTARALYQRIAEDVPQDSITSMVVTPNNDHYEEFMGQNKFEIIHSLWRTTTDSRRSVTLPIDFNKVFSLTCSNYALC